MAWLRLVNLVIVLAAIYIYETTPDQRHSNPDSSFHDGLRRFNGKLFNDLKKINYIYTS